MSLQHKDHHECARDIGPRLDQYLEAKRDRPFEAALREGFMFFAFTYEDFGKEAKKNKELFPKLAAKIVRALQPLRRLRNRRLPLDGDGMVGHFAIPRVTVPDP